MSSEVGDALAVRHSGMDVEEGGERVQHRIVPFGEFDRETAFLAGAGVVISVGLGETEEVGMSRLHEVDVAHVNEVHHSYDSAEDLVEVRPTVR